MVLIYLLTGIHIVVCLFLCIVVLLQSGKAADLAGAFGGMGSQTVFGPRGTATVLSKATTIAAVLFMITSLGLTVVANKHQASATGGGILEKYQRPVNPSATQPQKSPITVTPTPAKQAPAPAQGQGQAPATPKAPGK